MTVPTWKGGSRIPRVTCSSSPIDSTVSSATSQPKRQHDLTQGDDHSDRPRPRSPCMRATAYRHLFACGSPSCMRRNSDTAENEAEALALSDSSILPSEEQAATTSPPTMHIPDVPESTVPAMFGAEVAGESKRNKRIATKPRSPKLEPMCTHRGSHVYAFWPWAARLFGRTNTYAYALRASMRTHRPIPASINRGAFHHFKGAHFHI
ncbi:hypothetical protein PIB30_046999 [Stylosanthes scabra]|uniref:Uncharacterized protein n=1 Tax=Stylosanthes scabra TaxID=79078 RepID=A0ABU6XFN9_9FABA|nr:hypothetical protein [Stylosanthes scabra]